MSDLKDNFEPGDALLLVDPQNDFCPGGALPIEKGDQVMPVLNRWIGAAVATDTPIFVSRDWHPKGHPSFEEQGGEWPPHCLQDSEGAAFHPRLELPEDAVKVTKGVRFDQDQYSAFDQTGLADELRRRDIKRVWIGGLAQDVCVAATSIAGREEGFEVRRIKDATRPVTPEGGRTSLERMKKAGVKTVTTD